MPVDELEERLCLSIDPVAQPVDALGDADSRFPVQHLTGTRGVRPGGTHITVAELSGHVRGRGAVVLGDHLGDLHDGGALPQADVIGLHGGR